MSILWHKLQKNWEQALRRLSLGFLGPEGLLEKFGWQRIIKGLVLVLLKESYLFLRNLYGLIVHPFKTVVQIRKKPDWSQTFLVLGLPAWVVLGSLGVLVFALILFLIWQPMNEVFVNLIFAGVLLVLTAAAVVTGYVGFWLGKYLVYKKILHRF